jgi:signal transduction histidine kinase
MRRPLVALGVAAGGLAVGLYSLHVARSNETFWFAGGPTLDGAAFLAAGWAAVGIGLASWLRRPDSRFGPLLAAGGFGWFLLEWNNPGIGSALAFTVGLVLYASCAPVVGHAVLAHGGGRLGSHVERAAVGVAYTGAVLVVGLLPAMFFDPKSPAQGCSECPRNLALVSDRPDLTDDLTRIGLYLGAGWAAVLVFLAAWKLTRETAGALRTDSPVLATGAVYLGLVAAWYASSADEGILAGGTLQRRLWLGQAAALLALAAGVGWSWARSRRARSEVARLVVDLAQAPPVGGLRDALAGLVGDPDLVLAYPLPGSDRLVDARGRPVELSSAQQRTSLVRDGHPVAVLAHVPGVLDDEELVEELAATARLALENERLQAEVSARVDELRRSRARIVATGDAERKRLERDLHDGAQQRLVALSLSLSLVRSRLRDSGGGDPAAALDQADAELREAIAELRDLAHGIFPAVLADDGFAASVEALREEARVPIRIRRLPEGRFGAAAEAAAYTVVAEAARSATGPVSVDAELSDEALVVAVEGADGNLELVELQDRVRALDGRLDVTRAEDGRVKIRAELPCGS